MDEGVAHKIDDGVKHVRPRSIHTSLEAHLGGHLFFFGVLEQATHTTNHNLPELAQRVVVTILLAHHIKVLDDGFHIPCEASVLRGHFGVEAHVPLVHIELAVSLHEAVEFGQLQILQLSVQVERGHVSERVQLHAHGHGAAIHVGIQAHGGGQNIPFIVFVPQVQGQHFDAIHLDIHSRCGGGVAEPEDTVVDLHPVHPDRKQVVQQFAEGGGILLHGSGLHGILGEDHRRTLNHQFTHYGTAEQGLPLHRQVDHIGCHEGGAVLRHGVHLLDHKLFDLVGTTDQREV